MIQVCEEEASSKTALLHSKTIGTNSKFKFTFGIVALILVDVIWVGSSQVTSYLFKNINFDKPYMSTYIKISLFAVYLCGFMFYPPWQRQCIRCACDDFPGQYQLVGETDTDDTDDCDYTIKGSMSESIYVPANLPSELDSCSDGEKHLQSSKSRVKFNNLMEVKHLEDNQDAQIARMNYGAALRAKSIKKIINGKLTLCRIVRISFIFTFVFFLGNLSYQEALAVERVAIVNIFSSTSGIFTLILASFFPSGPMDRFTLTKFFAVLLSFGGIVIVSVASSPYKSSSVFSANSLTTGALWAVLGSLSYATYLVFFKKSVGEGDNVDVPMFFGFVGLFCFMLLWPGMAILHYIQFEKFELPSRLPGILLVANGLVGTVLSELLWLWGCLATSSLIGTLSLSMTIPLSIIADIIFQNVSYSWLFYFGSILVFLSFLIVSCLSHNHISCSFFGCVEKSIHCCCKNRKMKYDRVQEIPLTTLNDEDDEQ